MEFWNKVIYCFIVQLNNEKKQKMMPRGQEMSWHDQIPDKENQEEWEDDAEEAGDVARPLKEGQQDEEKQREELNCETHSVYWKIAEINSKYSLY